MLLQYFLMTLLCVTALFLILLVLVQRGRGGGLAGAFGGMGGQSAFGTKAGDLFTRVTIGVAAFWIILCAASVKLLGTSTNRLSPSLGRTSSSAPANPESEKGLTPPEGTKGTPAETAGATGTTPAGEKATTSAESSAPAASSAPATPPAATPVPAEPPDTPQSTGSAPATAPPVTAPPPAPAAGAPATGTPATGK